MEDLFKGYWWLLFPLAWFLIAGWQSWLKYRRSRDTLDLIKTYAASGKDVPPALLDRLGSRTLDDDYNPHLEAQDAPRRRYRSGFGGWSQVVLFASLTAGFGFAAATDIYEAGPAFVIVTFVMGALCLSSLAATLTRRSRD